MPCPDCPDPTTGKPRGLLWMGGNDYMECPTCDGKGWFPMVTEELIPPGKIFLPFSPKPLLVSQRIS